MPRALPHGAAGRKPRQPRLLQVLRGRGAIREGMYLSWGDKPLLPSTAAGLCRDFDLPLAVGSSQLDDLVLSSFKQRRSSCPVRRMCHRLVGLDLALGPMAVVW